jgi:hypothetical protein
MVLPEEEDMDSARHAWADARFATDIMSEHGLFSVLLMPPEVANEERMQALQLASDFAELHKKIASASAPVHVHREGEMTGPPIETIKPEHINRESQTGPAIEP